MRPEATRASRTAKTSHAWSQGKTGDCCHHGALSGPSYGGSISVTLLSIDLELSHILGTSLEHAPGSGRTCGKEQTRASPSVLQFNGQLLIPPGPIPSPNLASQANRGPNCGSLAPRPICSQTNLRTNSGLVSNCSQTKTGVSK